jgi:outer membrane protein OmpA-like peptidoglycan-associated protein
MRQLRKALFVSLVFLIPLYVVQAQEQDKAQSLQYYELAKEMVTATKAVDDARDLMVIAANFDTTNAKANFEAGYMYITTVNKELAEKFFNRVYRQQPSYRFDLEYWIGMSYQHGMRFDKALDYFNRYKVKVEKTSPNYSGKDKVPVKEVNRRIEECNNGKEFVANKKSFSIVNLGSGINSEYDDYAPVVNADETEIIFTTRRKDGNINDNVWDDNKPYEDIFVSTKEGGTWTAAKNIGTSLNTRFNNSNLTLSPTGNMLFVYKDGIGDGDIFFSERQPDRTWSIPKPLVGTINSSFRESSASITKDESTIYFSSERPGGLGGTDIWSATKNSKGAWSIIKNLGPSVNTEFEDDAPFIDYDGKTLYFSSLGRKGMGGHDIFKATLMDPTKNEWSEPENLGYPINTPDDDIFITGTSTPNRFFYASVRSDGFGYSDIYLVSEEVKKDEPVVAREPVKKETKIHKFILTVLDAETKQPLKAKVRMKGKDNTTLGSLITSDGVHEFVIMSPTAKGYIVYIEMEGYIFENLSLLLGGATQTETKEEKTIQLRKIKTGEVSVLRHVFFDTGKATLKPESFDELDKFLLMMEQNNKVRVEIGGHTDNVGSPAVNLKLSQQRALAVKGYLTSKGIEAKRVAAVGYGETKPVVSNDDEEGGRAINRRVEFKVLKN